MKTERRIAPAGVRFLVALVALSTISAGCAAVPTGRFDALAAASKGVETRTTQTDADLVKLTRRFMLFSPAPGPYRADSFAPVVEVGGARLDFDFGPRLEPRQAALGVLASYTEALAAFARKDYDGELDRAAHSLGGSVQRLAGHVTASAAAKQGAGVLATAVNGLGHAITERMRRAALRKTMDDAAPGIAAIVTFVKEINTLGAAAVTTMRDQMIRKANSLTVADGVARLQLNEAVEGVIVESNALLAQLKQESAAVDAIAPAHAEIRDSIDHDERAVLEKLKTLVAEVKRLQGVYSSLK
ncbi:MAG: hypothetical protein AUH76_19310 [Candidatus Rokubacteria bacterium 13_1_40CM_4_67_11]|nr:MAG: hypothetical protein AUH76_19310 [Candidatus Rokubacteria bacterium 13_1_40CM_4_67_11]